MPNKTLLQKTLDFIAHPPATLTPLTALQKEIGACARLEPLCASPKLIAGIDISYQENLGFICILVLNPQLEIVEKVLHSRPITFPYISGFLAFREFEIFFEAYKKLTVSPDLLFFDGQGMAHPRLAGIATHAGVVLDLPALGCAKSHLYGKWEMPGSLKGDKSPLYAKDKLIGYVIRSRERVKPIFASVGHKITPDQVYELSMTYSSPYKLPWPTHLAHNLATKAKKGQIEKNRNLKKS